GPRTATNSPAATASEKSASAITGPCGPAYVFRRCCASRINHHLAFEAVASYGNINFPGSALAPFSPASYFGSSTSLSLNLRQRRLRRGADARLWILQELCHDGDGLFGVGAEVADGDARGAAGLPAAVLQTVHQRRESDLGRQPRLKQRLVSAEA